MLSIHTETFTSPFGDLILGSYDGKLCLCDWQFRKMRTTIDTRIQNTLNAFYVKEGSEVIDETKMQLSEYFRRQRKKFDIPLLLLGSDFQKSVWKELLRVPFGQTSTYADLSMKLGNIDAIRAVASANGANAISIIVPCHRILGSDGSLTGYAGGLAAKKKLLQHENALPQRELPFGI